MKLGKSQRDKDIAGVASIAVFRGDRVLWLQRDDNGKWTMPGGHMEPGEEPLDAAIRELWEETGFKVKGKDLEYLGSKRVEGKNLEVHAFKTHIDDGDPSFENDPDGEAKDWYWFTPSELDRVEHHVPRSKNVTLSFLEEPEELSKGIKFWRSKDGLKIPHWTDPARREWDKGFHERLVQYMANGDAKRLKSVKVPVSENNMGHFVQGAVGAGGRNRVPLYERMLAGGDTVPPIVVRRNGLGWHVIDGNARMQAALNQGIKELDAYELVDPVKKAEPVIVDVSKTWPGRNYKLDYEFSPEELEKGLGTAIVLAGALAVGGARTPVQPHLQVKAAGKTPWSPVGLHSELIPIAHLESSFGVNVDHQKHSAGEFHTAIGALGMKPSTGHEEYLRQPDLQKKYPGLGDPADFMARMRVDHRFYNEVASAHWHRLRTLHQTPEKAAYAWRHGHGAARKASDAEVLKDLYVQKYKAMLLGTGLRKDEKPEEPKPEIVWPVWPQEKVDKTMETVKVGSYYGVRAVVNHYGPLPIDVQKAFVEHCPDYYETGRFAKRPDLHPDVYKALATHKDSTVREYLASSPFCPTELLTDLFHDQNLNVRYSVAENKKLPSELVTAAIGDTSGDVRSAVLRQGHVLTPEQRKMCVDSPHADTTRAFIENYSGTLTPEESASFFSSPHAEVRRVASDYLTPTREQFDRLAADSDHAVRNAAISRHYENYPLTADQLTSILNDNDYLEQAYGISHAIKASPNLTSDHAKLYITAENFDVYDRTRLLNERQDLPAEVIKAVYESRPPRRDLRSAALRHANAPPEIIEDALQSEDSNLWSAVFGSDHRKPTQEQVMRLFKKSPDDWAFNSVKIMAVRRLGSDLITPECIDLAMNTPSNSDLRIYALRHASTTQEQIERAFKDKDAAVRREVVMSPRATPAMLTAAMSDDSEDVVRAAVRNPNILVSDIEKGWKMADKDREYAIQREILRNPKCPVRIVRQALALTATLENARDPYSVRTLQNQAVKHPLLSAKDLEWAYKLPGFKYRESLMHHPSASEKLIQLGIKSREPGVREAAKRALGTHYPDGKFEASVVPKLGVAKLRLARDHIESKGVKELKPKEMPPGDWAVGRLPNGNIGADKIQAHIDAQPGTRFNISHDIWDGAQRHNEEPSEVFQVSLTNDHVNALKAAGVYNTFRKMHAASVQSAHPVDHDVGIGWVRYTGNPEQGFFIDEVQSDLGQSFVRQAAAQAAQQGVDPGEAARRAEQEYPEADYQKISQIVFNGKHPNELLTEAFHQWLRDWGHHNTQVHIHTVESKAPISLGRPVKTRTDAPGHFNVSYHDLPKKMGKEPRKYGDLPTQDNKQMQGQPTWGGPVRKMLDLETNLKKSIRDLKPGEEIANLNGYERYDYTHLIRSPLVRKKYRIFADHVPGWADNIRVRVVKNGSDEPVGKIDAAIDHKNKSVDPVYVEIEDPRHQGKGLGQAMYEALYSHAYHKLGVKKVVGGDHSSQAHRVHQILAERHGWDYAPAFEPHEWHIPRPMDNAAGNYEYILKAQ